MEDSKCQERSSRTGKGDVLAVVKTEFEHKVFAELDYNSDNKINENDYFSRSEKVNEILKVKKTNGVPEELNSEFPNFVRDSSNNGLIDQEQKYNIVIKKEILEDEETVESAEIMLRENITVKQEVCEPEESPKLVSNGEQCNCGLERKPEGAKKSLDFLVFNKVSSLKRNRSSHDLPADSGVDDEKKSCLYCRRSKVSSHSRRRPPSQASSEDICRTRSNSSISDSSDKSPRFGRYFDKKRKGDKRHKGEEAETDPIILARRQKQINYGKNTAGYKRYQDEVPKYRRTVEDPATPPKHVKYSRRGWDGLIRAWRRRLHNWDPLRTENSNDDDGSVLSESPAPTVSDDSETLMDIQTDCGNKDLLWTDDVEPSEEF